MILCLYSSSKHIQSLIQQYLKEEEPFLNEIKWYPNQLGWEFKGGRSDLKKDQKYASFHSWLVAQTELGNISRQEAVSMIPPLMLDVKPGHKV